MMLNILTMAFDRLEFSTLTPAGRKPNQKKEDNKDGRKRVNVHGKLFILIFEDIAQNVDLDQFLTKIRSIS